MKLKKLSEDDAKRLRDWWSGLDNERGDRAQLRRASNPDDVLLTSAFAHFLKAMPDSWVEGKTGKNTSLSMSDMALIAAVIARVKSEPQKADTTFARSLATPKENGSKAVMSELRFQQLQKSRSPEDFFLRVCRAVNLLSGKVNVVSLADDIAHWLIEFRYGPASKPEDRLAVRWASDYYTVFKD
ncbi:MAG: type I-E CRISPR-associated protein Cse2/CasB [Cellvibrio sp. 79]|nr:MAG: type I-E CRISPR-associated protein Cse2/CasB [Cellvibrio sp. 79]